MHSSYGVTDNRLYYMYNGIGQQYNLILFLLMTLIFYFIGYQHKEDSISLAVGSQRMHKLSQKKVVICVRRV